MFPRIETSSTKCGPAFAKFRLHRAKSGPIQPHLSWSWPTPGNVGLLFHQVLGGCGQLEPLEVVGMGHRPVQSRILIGET